MYFKAENQCMVMECTWGKYNENCGLVKTVAKILLQKCVLFISWITYVYIKYLYIYMYKYFSQWNIFIKGAQWRGVIIL